MNDVALKSPTIPLLRKVLIPIFMALCFILGFVLSEWAIIEALRGLTVGEWIYNSLDFKITIIAYSITGLTSSFAGLWWFLRSVLLLSRHVPVWTDTPLSRMFAAAALSFILMNLLHIWSEDLICNAGILDLCTF